MLQAVLDPYVNAVHVSLLRAKDDPPRSTEERFIALRTTLLSEGPKAITPRDRKALLMDAESMHWLHQEAWATPAAHLAPWWRSALLHYTRLAPAPQTAFSR
jgi:membrane glycosyltransferase